MTEPTSQSSVERHPHGEVRCEVVDDHVLVLTVDRVEKKNAFTPKIAAELEDALTRLDDDPDLFIGVLTFAGDRTTAGFEMPLFFPGRQRERAIELARQMLQCSPTALRHTIANASVALDENEPAVIAAIPAMDKIVQATDDFKEGIASFIERRPAKFTGR